MKVLGIETSCDETAAAVVEMNQDGSLSLISSVVASSMDLHAVYGGVVPEIAARSHIEHIMPIINKALNDATSIMPDPWENIDAIAVTQGPGLGGSLLVGVVTARTLSLLKNKPLFAVNHVMAHPIATFITSGPEGYKFPTNAPEFPMLSLIVSGGHTQLVVFKTAFDYEVLGRTRDDAIGEAFDKVAKILGLPYPGGPSVEKKAKEGNPQAFKFPKAKLEGGDYDFSFSGLKTAVLRASQKQIGEDYHFPSTGLAERLSETEKADISASFQAGAIETLVEKTVKAYASYLPKSVVVAGGVAASPELRIQLQKHLPIDPLYPDMKLCTDNGAMIAALGCFMHQANNTPSNPYELDISPNLSM